MLAARVNVCARIEQGTDDNDISAHSGDVQRSCMPVTMCMHVHYRHADEITQLRHLRQKLLEDGIFHAT